MSNYFNLVPDFEYVSRLPDAKISDYITVKNLFKRAFLREDIYQNLTFFTKYSIKGNMLIASPTLATWNHIKKPSSLFIFISDIFSLYLLGCSFLLNFLKNK